MALVHNPTINSDEPSSASTPRAEARCFAIKEFKNMGKTILFPHILDDVERVGYRRYDLRRADDVENRLRS